MLESSTHNTKENMSSSKVDILPIIILATSICIWKRKIESEKKDRSEAVKSSNLSYIFSDPILKGQSLYLGGEYCPETKKIYCIPGHASHVLEVDVLDDKAKYLGDPIKGKFKYLRAIYVPQTKIIYGLPCNSDSVLRIDPLTGNVTIMEIPFETEQEKKQPWKYHGGAIHPANNCIYAIPQSATKVLKIDPFKDTLELVGPDIPGKYKFYGGVVSCRDNAIYGIPHNYKSALRIDLNSDGSENISLHGDFPEGLHSWHGGSATMDGYVVGIPANAETVLLIKPPDKKCSSSSEDSAIEIEEISLANVATYRTDRKFKYLGAVTCPLNNKVYLMPSGVNHVLEIDVSKREAKEIGPVLTTMEKMGQNKWQNGFFSYKDKSIYGIPLNGESVLRIRFHEDMAIEPTVTTIELPDPKGGLSKWEGGVMCPESGGMYCMPNNHKAVLKINPILDE